VSASEHSLAEIIFVGSAEPNDTKQNGVSSCLTWYQFAILCWKYFGFLDCSLFAHVLQILMPGVREEWVHIAGGWRE